MRKFVAAMLAAVLALSFASESDAKTVARTPKKKRSRAPSAETREDRDPGLPRDPFWEKPRERERDRERIGWPDRDLPPHVRMMGR